MSEGASPSDVGPGEGGQWAAFPGAPVMGTPPAVAWRQAVLTLDTGVAGGVSARRVEPEAGASWTFVYAPGAGSHIDDPFGGYAARQLLEHGASVLRLQFPYQEVRRRRPDPPAVLEATWRAALAEARERSLPVVAGGRSMGGRIASQVVAQGESVAALALFAYPLHPPVKPEQRRDQHLAAITAPLLFCSGDRDTFATVSELQELAGTLPNARLHLLAGADHGFGVLKASGRRRTDVWDEAIAALLAFVEDLGL